MTPERWQQIDQIFAEALDRATDERVRFWILLAEVMQNCVAKSIRY